MITTKEYARIEVERHVKDWAFWAFEDGRYKYIRSVDLVSALIGKYFRRRTGYKGGGQWLRRTLHFKRCMETADLMKFYFERVLFKH
jgi:hypothetical protein